LSNFDLNKPKIKILTFKNQKFEKKLIFLRKKNKKQIA